MLSRTANYITMLNGSSSSSCESFKEIMTKYHTNYTRKSCKPLCWDTWIAINKMLELQWSKRHHIDRKFCQHKKFSSSCNVRHRRHSCPQSNVHNYSVNRSSFTVSNLVTIRLLFSPTKKHVGTAIWIELICLQSLNGKVFEYFQAWCSCALLQGKMKAHAHQCEPMLFRWPESQNDFLPCTFFSFSVAV